MELVVGEIKTCMIYLTGLFLFPFLSPLQTSSSLLVDFIPLGCLLQYLRHNKHLVEKTEIILDMAIQICSAMKFLEANKFIHRDLVRLTAHPLMAAIFNFNNICLVFMVHACNVAY